MAIHERAGTLPISTDIIDINLLLEEYYKAIPTKENIADSHKISFGTSGHRGKANNFSFNEEHILAITQAVCEIRAINGIHGTLFLGMDTHALSFPAFKSAIEILVANNVYVAIQKGTIGNEFTPTPVISHAILNANKDINSPLCDGIVITPSHNPPTDGGFKYNPSHGGPADTNITKKIEERANYLLINPQDIKRIPFENAIQSKYIIEHDYISEYVNDLEKVIDFSVIQSSNIKIGVDPLSGSSLQYWKPIADKYQINLHLISENIDPSFKTIPLDHDGKIRMDCSSKYVMSSLLAHKDDFDICFGNDPDADRHGIITKSGLVPANHFLAVACDYLLKNRPQWQNLKDKEAKIGKTIVTSSMLDRIANSHGSAIYEVPVGFKYFVEGLNNGSLLFACEESAGASFLCFDGSAWSTDKDGILLCLLSAEIMARTGKNPSELYDDLEKIHGKALYTRIDSQASPELKSIFKNFKKEQVNTKSLCKEEILDIITKTKGNNENFGGFKIETKSSWFAARPSGTEDIYKVYIETFLDADKFDIVQKEAVDLINNLLK